MKRTLTNIACALSLLLSLTAAGSWVQSYHGAYSRSVGSTKELIIHRGQIVYYHWHSGWYSGMPGAPWRYGGFYYYDRNFFAWSVPHWAIVVIFAIFPALVVHSRMRSRARLGLCGKCGYDLRASTERCPECGTPIPVSDPTPVMSA